MRFFNEKDDGEGIIERETGLHCSLVFQTRSQYYSGAAHYYEELRARRQNKVSYLRPSVINIDFFSEVFFYERETGLEPAAFSLARKRSTN